MRYPIHIKMDETIPILIVTEIWNKHTIKTVAIIIIPYAPEFATK